MQGLSFFEGVLPTLETTSSLMYEAEKEESTIKGIDALYPSFHPLEIVEGSFFTQRSLEAGLPICLLNKQAKVKLFGDKLAVGRCIWLHNTAVHVIGVVEIMGN
ncbi:MAG: ABC transporter permease, partial [Candidatus Cardinium sp.]|nr:ABC transporter permease [Candidatus Cardinium sp.]